MARLTNMQRLERLVADLPQAERVDIEAWDDHPSFRVRSKNFVFSNTEGTSLGFKLPTEEAAAVVASDPSVTPMGYGLGRHGWVSLELEARPSADRWAEVTEWIRTSYTLVAPKRLAALVRAADGLDD